MLCEVLSGMEVPLLSMEIFQLFPNKIFFFYLGQSFHTAL